MVASMLHELAGSHPSLWFDGSFLHQRIDREWKAAWDAACRRAAEAGSAEELHAARDDYQTVLIALLKILDGASTLTRFGTDRTSAPIATARDELQKHYGSLFPRWQTLEDLEAILLERVSTPNNRLKRLAARHAPPAGWYGEPDDPLAPQG